MFWRRFGTLCRKRGIKQELTPADSPKHKGVAERAVALISDTALATRIKLSYSTRVHRPTRHLWAEAVSWACNTLNRTATKANPANKFLYEMWYGSPPLAREVWPFLKPAIYRVYKSQPKAQDCYYVVPSVNHPRDCMRVFNTHRTILTIRNVTWHHVPPAFPAPQQHLPPIAEEGESIVGEGARGVGASGEGAPSQGGRRVADLDSKSDLDMTGVGPVLGATRKAPAVEAGAGTGEVAEGSPPTPSARSRRAEIGSANDSSNSKDDSTSRRGSDSNTSHTTNGSSSTSGSGSSGDISALTWTEARRLRHLGKTPKL